MKTKHTKGNWTIVHPYGVNSFPGIDAIGNYGEGNFSVIILGTKDELSGVQGKNNEEIIANAKLIASAPDLLDACMSLLQNFEINKKYNNTLTEMELTAGINILTRVIKKATE